MVFDEVLPLYFTAPTYAGGLGVSSSEFAKTLSLLGGLQLVFQFVIYPRLTLRFNTLLLCQFAFLVYIPVYLIFPELTTLLHMIPATNSWTLRVVYTLILIVRYGANCLTYTSLGIMVRKNNVKKICYTTY